MQAVGTIEWIGIVCYRTGLLLFDPASRPFISLLPHCDHNPPGPLVCLTLSACLSFSHPVSVWCLFSFVRSFLSLPFSPSLPLFLSSALQWSNDAYPFLSVVLAALLCSALLCSLGFSSIEQFTAQRGELNLVWICSMTIYCTLPSSLTSSFSLFFLF